MPKSLKELSPLAIAKNANARLVAVNHPYEFDFYAFNSLVIVKNIYFAVTETEWNPLIKDYDFSEYGTAPSVMDDVTTVHFNETVGSDVECDVNADVYFLLQILL